jgi:hypothetical protein
MRVLTFSMRFLPSSSTEMGDHDFGLVIAKLQRIKSGQCFIIDANDLTSLNEVPMRSS